MKLKIVGIILLILSAAGVIYGFNPSMHMGMKSGAVGGSGPGAGSHYLLIDGATNRLHIDGASNELMIDGAS